MDAAIVCTCQNDPTAIYCLLLEMKYTTSDLPSGLKGKIAKKLSTQIQNRFAKQLREAAKKNDLTCHVISVFVAWHNLPRQLLQSNIWNEALMLAAKNSKANVSEDDFSDAILVLGREQLKTFYSSMSPYAEFAFGATIDAETQDEQNVEPPPYTPASKCVLL